MNSSRSMPTTLSGLKCQISSLSSACSSAVRFWLVALVGFIAVAQTGWGQNLTQSGFTSVTTPQYMASGTSTRLPVMFRATLTGLTASTTFRYFCQGATNSTAGGGTVDFGTTNSGAGNSLLISPDGSTFSYTTSPSVSTAGAYQTFTTDASGAYTGWFGLVQSGNARFTAGNSVFPSITIANTSGTVLIRRALDVSMTALTFSTSAGATNGSFLKGASSGTAKNMAVLYDNTSATGRPLFISPIESIGVTIASVITGYATSAGSWNAIIPNTNANGVRRVEQRSVTTNALVGVNTDADGSWPSGVNTVNPTSGTTALSITSSDAPINTSASSTITGAATGSAFTTTYGTPSAAQTFSVSGANLTANLTATAPTGFEVASDGATYGPTATFTQSSGSASGTLYLRLRATAAVSGSYNSQNIVLSSTGATSVNIVTAASGNAVSPKALSITASNQNKTYGFALALGTSAFTSDGLLVPETIGSVTLTSSGSAASAAAGGYSITASAATGGTFTPGNYIITYSTGTLTVDPKPLTITANAVTKAFGDTLASPVSGSTAFTSNGLVGIETIGSVTITYGNGAGPFDDPVAYPNQVTPSAAVGGTFNIANYLPNYVSATLTVTDNPTITVNGTLSAVNTIYGTASNPPASFSLSGIFLTGDLTVTPPAGFEASIGGGYSNPLTVPASGTLGSTTVFVRLAAVTAFGTYSGDITVSGGGATSKTVATVSSSVAKKALTISGLTGGNKPYDRTVAATTTGTAAYDGLENGESFTVTGTPTASFANVTVGTAKPITVSGYTAPSDNYSVSQPSGLTGDITPLALTVTGATVTSRPFNGGAVASITGSTLVGVISPDVVTIATSPGTFADVNAGTGIAVTAALTLGGADAGNYSLTQPTSLIGDITKVNQFITFAALPDKLTTDAPFALSATGGLSGLPVTFAASPPSGVVTISGNTVTIVGAGTATITASQAGNTNYNAATDVARTLTVIVPPLANWTGPWTGTAASPLAATTKDANLTSASLARVGLTGASSNARYSSSGWNTTANYMTASLSATSGYLVNLNGAIITGTWGSSNTGPVSFDVRSSVDNYTSSIGTFNSSSSSATTSITLPASNYNGLSSITFRFVGSATGVNGSATQSGGTGGPISLTLNGIVVVQPSISGAATAGPFTTSYGTPSTEQSFLISGTNLVANLVATAPTGFEVSVDGTAYASTATFTPSSGSASGSLRIRLVETAPVSGSYNSQSIVLSSTNATSVNITSAASGNTVTPAALTITGINANDKTYDNTVTATLSGTPTYVGLVNSETFPVSGTAIASFADPSVGTGKPVTVTGYTAPSGNYTVAQPVGLTANIISIYANWSNGFPGFTDTATTSNPDNDALSNLLEFAFGTDPTLSTPGTITYANGVISANGQPTTSITNVTNGVDYRAVFGRRKDHVNAGLTYTVQFSAGLDIWVDSTDTPTVVASDATMDAVTVPYPFFIPTSRGVEKPTFFRVAVTSN